MGLIVNHVHFKYNQGENTYALKNINLHIPANCMTAIVGKSGAGKSTLIDILMGLNQPDRGEVTIDDVPLTSELIVIKEIYKLYSQDPFLFNATIRKFNDH